MTRPRLRSRATTRRLAYIDAYPFPTSVRLRFAAQHESLSTDNLDTVQAGTRQWFRLAARHPKAKLSMPSILVDDMWHELVLHTRDYAEFCEAAIGRFLHHTPESAMNADAAAANGTAGLALTYRLAQQDEGGEPGGRLPLLFRVDRELGISGGRRYLADCGGRGECHELPGVLCLQHIDGPGRRHRIHRRHGPSTPDKASVYPVGNNSMGCAGGICSGGT